MGVDAETNPESIRRLAALTISSRRSNVAKILLFMSGGTVCGQCQNEHPERCAIPSLLWSPQLIFHRNSDAWVNFGYQRVTTISNLSTFSSYHDIEDARNFLDT